MKKMLSDLRNRFKNFRYDPLDSLYFTVQTHLCSLLGAVPVLIYSIILNTGYKNVTIYDVTLGHPRMSFVLGFLGILIHILSLYFIFMRGKVSSQYYSDGSDKLLWLKVGCVYIIPGELLRFIFSLKELKVYGLSFDISGRLVLYSLVYGIRVGENNIELFNVLLILTYFICMILVLLFLYRSLWKKEKSERLKLTENKSK